MNLLINTQESTRHPKPSGVGVEGLLDVVEWFVALLHSSAHTTRGSQREPQRRRIFHEGNSVSTVPLLLQIGTVKLD